jgi:hypothetical protein
VTPRLSRTAVSALIALVTLALAPGAFAASEQGDAGDLRATAQDLGDAPVTTISGSFASAADADVYRLCLSNGSSFSASTIGGIGPGVDSQMFLLDSEGLGVYANDDWPGSRGSLLPANHRFSPTRGGEYFLAISEYNRDPHSNQGEIFQDGFDRLFYPDGVINANGFGSAQPHTSWMGRAPGGPGSYVVTVTGSTSCVPPDTTAPTVDLRSPVDGARVRQGANVVADFSCADEGGSGLASCVGSIADGALLDTSTLGAKSVTVTARDGAGNQTVVTHTVTVIDETAPSISLTTPVEGAVYTHGEQVLADYACADEAGGSGVATCSGTVADGAPVDTASIGEKTFTVEAKDAAGNSASKTVKYRVVDTAPPAITLTAPVDGAVYSLGERVLAAYGCQDQPGGSGVATCQGSVPNGAAIDTSRLGTHSFEVRAADGAGNAASRTVSYSVVYDFDGFLRPVSNPPAVNRWKAGVPVPIRFSLDGFRGPNPEAPGFPRSTRCGGGDTEQAARSSKRRPVFRYERGTDRYVMLWKTQRRWAGSCREFELKLDDGSVHTARFQFTKKRDKKGKSSKHERHG